ncbi:MAG: DUF3386 domain-containing protein [Blastocatellia bacterium]|nr:DUF3386 domain-containing protein [Blastocatellia bacterium]
MTYTYQDTKTNEAAAGNPAADPEAYALLQSIHESRQTWPSEFAGFAANVRLNDNGRSLTGRAEYSPENGVKLKIDGFVEPGDGWFEDQIRSIFGHRRGGSFAAGDGRFPLTFGPDEGHPLGRMVCLNDQMQSTYRLGDGYIAEVSRTMGEERFVITVLEVAWNENGKYLPKHFLVTYFNLATQAISKVDAYSDSFTLLDGFWIPTSRRVIRTETGSFTVRTIEFQNPQLLRKD